MSTIQEIEAAVTQLSPAQLADFRVWFTEYDAQKWDNQIARDAAAGRLDSLAQKALAARESTEEREEWYRLAAYNLARAYSDEESDYTVDDLQIGPLHQMHT